MNPVAELDQYSSRFAARCREKGWLAALFHVGVISDIAADIRAYFRRCAGVAHQCEVRDLEAAKLLDIEAQNELLPKKDREVLRHAARMIRRNAHSEHTLSEQLSG